MADIITPINPVQTHLQMQQAVHENYGIEVAIALDKLGNTLTGGNSDETISARCGRDTLMDEEAHKHTHALADFMSWWLAKLQKDHGAKAAAGDVARAEQDITLEEASGIIQAK